jgi:Protein of unknown function (DUF2924)
MMPAHQDREARQETGGPSRRGECAPGSHAEVGDIEGRIIAFEALTTADLRIEWRRLYRITPPTRLSRDLLLRGIVYRVQELAQGGLSLGARRRLRSGAKGLGERSGAGVTSAIALKPGTKLVREWHGRVHTVSVLDDGFEYQGERYPSLTRIARRITGVAWSGPRFFGIGRRGQGAEGAAHE